jgi:hypothetical protein
MGLGGIGMWTGTVLELQTSQHMTLFLSSGGLKYSIQFELIGAKYGFFFT